MIVQEKFFFLSRVFASPVLRWVIASVGSNASARVGTNAGDGKGSESAETYDRGNDRVRTRTKIRARKMSSGSHSPTVIADPDPDSGRVLGGEGAGAADLLEHVRAECRRRGLDSAGDLLTLSERLMNRGHGVGAGDASSFNSSPARRDRVVDESASRGGNEEIRTGVITQSRSRTSGELGAYPQYRPKTLRTRKRLSRPVEEAIAEDIELLEIDSRIDSDPPEGPLRDVRAVGSREVSPTYSHAFARAHRNLSRAHRYTPRGGGLAATLIRSAVPLSGRSYGNDTRERDLKLSANGRLAARPIYRVWPGFTRFSLPNLINHVFKIKSCWRALV